MENQIKLYHDLTAFWLDKEWKTPREKQLEKQVAQLTQDNNNLKVQNRVLQQELDRQVAQLTQENNNLKVQNRALQQELGPLSVFKNIPCDYCGRPMTGWTRNEVEEAFKGWRHVSCG